MTNYYYDNMDDDPREDGTREPDPGFPIGQGPNANIRQEPRPHTYQIEVGVLVTVNPIEWEKMTDVADPGSTIDGIPPATWQQVELEAVRQVIRDELQRQMSPTLDATVFTSRPQVTPQILPAPIEPGCEYEPF